MQSSDRLVSEDLDSLVDAAILNHPRHRHPHPGRQPRVQICPANKGDRDRKCVPRCIEIACSAYLQSVAFPRPNRPVLRVADCDLEGALLVRTKRYDRWALPSAPPGYTAHSHVASRIRNGSLLECSSSVLQLLLSPEDEYSS